MKNYTVAKSNETGAYAVYSAGSEPVTPITSRDSFNDAYAIADELNHAGPARGPVVHTESGINYTEAQLSTAFDEIKNPLHWKDPISAHGNGVMTLNLYTAAIKFFTATVPTVTQLGGGCFRIVSVGYRRGPAGDN